MASTLKPEDAQALQVVVVLCAAFCQRLDVVDLEEAWWRHQPAALAGEAVPRLDPQVPVLQGAARDALGCGPAVAEGDVRLPPCTAMDRWSGGH